MDQGFENGVVCLTGGKTLKIGGAVILDHYGDGWMEGPFNKAKAAIVKIIGISDKTIKDVWPGWTPAGEATVYDAEFVYGPLEVTSEVYGKLTMSSISLKCRECNGCKCKDSCKHKKKCKCNGTTLTWREGVRQYLKKNHPTNTLPIPLIEVEEEESSDDDPSPPAKRRRRETPAERLKAMVDRRMELDPAAVKADIQAEFIVRNKMRPDDENGNKNEFPLYRGSKVCHYVDNVNLSTGWFDEFKVLSSHNALKARGQVDTYGSKLQIRFGKRLKSRIAFFTRQDRDDAKMRSEFEGIIEDYTNIPFSYGLDEVVLVHMSDLNVDEDDACLKVIARSQLQGYIA